MESKIFDGSWEEKMETLNAEDVKRFRHSQDILKTEDWLTKTCDRGQGYFIWTEPVEDCEYHPQFAKKLVCNKEWCSDCGADNSIAHNRRFIRWFPKIQQFKDMGYFIFTLPVEVRPLYRTREALSKLGHDIQDILKVHGYDRGLRRYHFFGDESIEWHPHLNVMVEGTWVSKKVLKSIKAEYAALLGVKMADVNYHFRSEPGKMIHTLKYVTRATFHDSNWDREMAVELRKFRNMVVWGRPDKYDKETGELEEVREWRDLARDPEAAAWNFEDLESKEREELENIDINAVLSIGSGNCPGIGTEQCSRCNHTELKPWSSALPLKLLNIEDFIDLGAGYYYRALKKPFDTLSEVEKKDFYREPITKEREDIFSGRLEEYALEREIHRQLAADIARILTPLGLKPSRDWIMVRIAKIKAMINKKEEDQSW